MHDQPPVDRPPEGCWLTYTEAAQLLGISSEALRSLARRNRWDRRSSNAVGGHSWVLVPPDRLPTGGHEESDPRPSADGDPRRAPENPLQTSGRDAADLRPTDRHEDRRLEEILTAVRSLGDAVTALGSQLIRERERADRAEERAREAEGRTRETEVRVRELQEQLAAELIEHREIVRLLTERIPARRSWRLWRRR